MYDEIGLWPCDSVQRFNLKGIWVSVSKAMERCPMVIEETKMSDLAWQKLICHTFASGAGSDVTSSERSEPESWSGPARAAWTPD